jgi:hypothetical protein
MGAKSLKRLDRSCGPELALTSVRLGRIYSPARRGSAETVAAGRAARADAGARGLHFESTLRPQVALLYDPVGAVAGGVVWCSSRSGNETVTVVPTPGSLANPMRPASAATML